MGIISSHIERIMTRINDHSFVREDVLIVGQSCYPRIDSRKEFNYERFAKFTCRYELN